VEPLDREAPRSFVAAHQHDFESWLARLVKMPSVSVDPAHRADVRRCAEGAVERIAKCGAAVELIETGR